MAVEKLMSSIEHAINRRKLFDDKNSKELKDLSLKLNKKSKKLLKNQVNESGRVKQADLAVKMKFDIQREKKE